MKILERGVTDCADIKHRAGGEDVGEALAEITASLSAEADVDTVLARFLGAIVKLTGADAAAVQMLTEDGLRLRVTASIGLPAEVLKREQSVSATCGVCGEAVQKIFAHDSKELLADCNGCCRFFGLGFHNAVAIPIPFQGKVLGIYSLFLAEGQTIPDTVWNLLRSIGELLGMAFQNARLMAENLRVGLLRERQSIASDVHDSLAQTLSYMKMRMSLLQDALRQNDSAQSQQYALEINETLGSAYSSLRQLLTNFRNPVDPEGLLFALQQVKVKFCRTTGIRVDLTNNASDLNLCADQASQVFYIVQEALNNIAKHANATCVKLTLDRKDGWVEICVEDNGAGMSANGTPANAGDAETAHLGLDIMRERARHLRGQLKIESASGRGTRVHLRFRGTFATDKDLA